MPDTKSEKSEMKVSVTGGQMKYPNFSSTLSPDQQAIAKLMVWLELVNQQMRPKRWLKTTKNGTSVNFEMLESAEAVVAEMTKVQTYVDKINDEFGFGIELNKKRRNEP